MSDDLKTKQRDEYFSTGTEVAPPEKSMALAPEFPECGEEHPSAAPEIAEPSDEFFEYMRPAVREKKKEKSKMGYLVTAALTAVAVTAGATAATVTPAVSVLPEEIIEVILPSEQPEPTPEPTPEATPEPEADYSFLDGVFTDVYEAFSDGRFYDAARCLAANENALSGLNGSGLLEYDGTVRESDGAGQGLMLVSFGESEAGMSSSGTGRELVFRFEKRKGLGTETYLVYMCNGETDVLRGDISEDLSAREAVYEYFYAEENGIFPMMTVRGALKEGHFSGPVTYETYPFETLDPDGVGSLSDIEPTARRYFDLGEDGRVHLADIDYASSDETYAFVAFEDPDCRYFLDKSGRPSLYVREYPTDPDDGSITYSSYDLKGDATGELFSIEHLTEAFKTEE